MVARGKAALGRRPGQKPTPPNLSLFPSWFAPKPFGATRLEKEREDHFGSVTPGCASLAQGYLHIVPLGLQVSAPLAQ